MPQIGLHADSYLRLLLPINWLISGAACLAGSNESCLTTVFEISLPSKAYSNFFAVTVAPFTAFKIFLVLDPGFLTFVRVRVIFFPSFCIFSTVNPLNVTICSYTTEIGEEESSTSVSHSTQVFGMK